MIKIAISFVDGKKYFAEPPVPIDRCNPTPCGPNAQCNNGECICVPEYRGNPYQGCRPECVQNTDCRQTQACYRNKCQDPCVNTCGQNAICNVYNHVPMCSCPVGMSGNAFVVCNIFRGAKNSIYFTYFQWNLAGVLEL